VVFVGTLYFGVGEPWDESKLKAYQTMEDAHDISARGPSATSRDVRFFAAVRGQADIGRDAGQLSDTEFRIWRLNAPRVPSK
jgi:hypothetical protein